MKSEMLKTDTLEAAVDAEATTRRQLDEQKASTRVLFQIGPHRVVRVPKYARQVEVDRVRVGRFHEGCLPHLAA